MKYADKYGFIGWREFLSNRQEILVQYDNALEKNSNRPVRTSHGNAAEAAFRKLLSNHLPQRYGVTSGYIIPDIVSTDYKLYHFDVIIYDKLNSPVLWSEDDFDTSDLGKKLAIPAKYVLSVIEIKSTFNKKNVNEAIAKLKSLEAFSPYLHPYFSSNAVFVEIKNTEIENVDILNSFLFDNNIRFWGGMIIRSDINSEMTGLISYSVDENPNVKESAKSQVLVRDVNEIQLILKKDGAVTMKNGGYGGGCDLYIDDQKKSHFGKAFLSHAQDKNLFINLNWSYSSFASYIIKILHLLENVNTHKENKYFFGKVYDIPEVE
ncbi:DUF6602 domain-containing protein [Flavobacterium collinsii]|uniref:DUF6602 domain-containing protein n=1 Tax=Flavobacterium collinsii TaxID=1114861 RepID=UPI00249293E0|nr:DUF6602 domain-containing protein [Flavobacterium collinsii]